MMYKQNQCLFQWLTYIIQSIYDAYYQIQHLRYSKNEPDVENLWQATTSLEQHFLQRKMKCCSSEVLL